MTYKQFIENVKYGFVVFSINSILVGMDGKTFSHRILYFVCWMMGWLLVATLVSYVLSKIKGTS